MFNSGSLFLEILNILYFNFINTDKKIEDKKIQSNKI